MTVADVELRVLGGHWVEAVRHVYVVVGSPETPDRRLAVPYLRAPHGSVVSHLSAAAVLGLIRHPPVPHLTVPTTASVRLAGAVVHRRRTALRGPDVCRVGPFRCTSPAQTLVDCAALLEYDAFCDLLDRALCRDLTKPAAVRAAAEGAGPGPGRKGIPQVLRALEVWQSGARPDSPPEMALFRRLLEWGFAMPQRQVQIRDEAGRFVARVDIALVERKVVLEYDGGETHSPRRQPLDQRREDRVRALGWTVVRVTKNDLRRPATRLRSRLRSLLLADPAA